MGEQLKKRDYEYSHELIKPKVFELWANVDSFGRKLIYNDSEYKISVDSYSNPRILRLFTKATKGDKKVGELVCFRKTFYGKNYVSMKYVKIDSEHRGQGYSYKMINCLLAILDEEVEGLITAYKSRYNQKPMYQLFVSLGGYINEFEYLEIRNPKK